MGVSADSTFPGVQALEKPGPVGCLVPCPATSANLGLQALPLGGQQNFHLSGADASPPLPWVRSQEHRLWIQTLFVILGKLLHKVSDRNDHKSLFRGLSEAEHLEQCLANKTGVFVSIIY